MSEPKGVTLLALRSPFVGHCIGETWWTIGNQGRSVESRAFRQRRRELIILMVTRAQRVAT